MESTNTPTGSPKYWLSLDQWRQDPEFQKLVESEFQSSPLRDGSEQDGGWARREFLKLMGASIALTSFGCIRRPAQTIVPYAKRPTDLMLGIANHYSSSFQDGSETFGIVVTTREGRPIKVEGNPEHPINAHGMSARAHAHILSLYDPDRLNGPRRNLLNEKKTNRDTIGVKWSDMDKAVAEQLKKGGVAILTSSMASPSTRKLVGEFASAFGAQKYSWDAIGYEAVAEGQARSYGRAVIPNYRIDKARVIVSVGCDFLGTYLSPTEFSRQFAKGRKANEEMNKLVVFESALSLTGSNADERFRVRPNEMLSVLLGLAAELVKNSRFASDGTVRDVLSKYQNVPKTLNIPATPWRELVLSLEKNKGRSLIMAGGLETQTEDALAIQVAANFLNSLLENEGSTVDGSRAPYSFIDGSYSDLAKLVADLKAKKVKTLIIHRANPVYSAPRNSEVVEALRQAEMVIYTGDRLDETGELANYIATDHHEMENWGDMEGRDGVYSIQQPTIRPLGDTRAFEDSLMAWSKAAGKSGRIASTASWYDYLREEWKNRYNNNRSHALAKGSFEEFWIALLQNGVMDTSSGGGSARNFIASALKGSDSKAAEPYQLVLYSTVGLKDGTLANVSWLQEFPDPVTKICWDNYICVSPKDAEREHWREGQMLKLSVGESTVDAPVHIQPGQADGVLALAVGYGRKAAGRVANGVGVNAWSLAQADERGVVYAGLAAQVKASKTIYPMANTQGHHTMEGRHLVIEATLEDYKKSPKANLPNEKVFSLWDEHKYPGHKWGMVIDLNTCTGCSACVIACQSENNIPTVGKKYVLRGREMHWLRIDRYYVGNPEDPAVVNQPLPCQHCDNAPCETVCPVAATQHSEEGTNDMIYNRCVGTRYCANNCPYKVRRFNWFNYTKTVAEPLNLAMNPEVTVRSRGVMEKCTFCIHRIKTAKRAAANDGRELKDGDVKSACQQSCPTNAIVFGDLNDKNSEVRKLFESENSYSLLEQLMTKPAVRYRSKVRNTSELKGEHGGHHA